MFTVEYRAWVRDELIDKARSDPRIVAAAAVGGSAEGDGDRWSDLDLTFGVAPVTSRDEVLTDWTHDMRSSYNSVTLFDLPFGSSLYRVFLLPGALQVDLSFTPSADFGAIGPRFALLFGTAVERPAPPPGSARQEFGLAVHHVVRARYCIRRARLWQAEHWIHQARDLALTLACRRLDLEPGLGRGFDSLPPALLEKADGALVRSTNAQELLRALRATSELLLDSGPDVHEDSASIESMLREVLD